MKFSIRVFFGNLPRKLEIYYILTRITGTLHEYLCACMIIYSSVLLKIGNISIQFVEKIKKNFNNLFFPPENLAVYEIMWENNVERSRPQMKIWRMRIA